MKKPIILPLVLSIVLGIAIAWIDSRPNWDDTGVSVFMVLLAGLLCGYLASQKPWLIALAVSAWIPLFSIISTHNYGAFLALIPGFLGAYIGYFAKRKSFNSDSSL
jgi:uncharacterized membrane protein